MFHLPALPYPMDALEPHVSRETLSIHHGRHHAAYIDKANAVAEEAGVARDNLEGAMMEARKAGNTGLFRQTAQAWNHEFLWHSMSPDGGGDPEGDIATRIAQKFGSTAEFRTAFLETAMAAFGSGWVWLVLERGRLGLMTTKDAGNPLCYGSTPLLTLDVWEHAYYIDYRNDRKSYVSTWLDHLINWRFAEENLRAATA